MPPPRSSDTDRHNEESATMAARVRSSPFIVTALKRLHQAMPTPIRKALVLTTGGALIAIGLMLIVLPGPFTLPLVIAGVAILSTEFAWAGMLLKEGKKQSLRLLEILRNPWFLLSVLLAVVVIVISVYSAFFPGWWH